ncbi:MAG TPA: riboflavin synthase [Planctomycetota bacterium]|nr:riboflavin synthase [Planctomycetota bacterium]
MFTGLIQHVGTLHSISPQSGGGARLAIDMGPLAADAKTGDSIAINGTCLTVVTLSGALAEFDAVPETLKRTTLGMLRAGDRVNLEPAMLPHSRLGGHFVQGHVDGTATVARTVEGGRWAEWHFTLDDVTLAEQIVEKGSIAIDGISLTVAGCDAAAGTFWVALIPETLARTTIGSRKKGAKVNIETDILGKYVLAALKRTQAKPAASSLTEEKLREQGY